MPVNYYPNKTVEELKAMLVQLQSRQLKGGITEVAAAGIKTARDFSKSSNPEQEILRVLYALHVARPEDWDNPYANKITRTRARYTWS